MTDVNIRKTVLKNDRLHSSRFRGRRSPWGGICKGYTGNYLFKTPTTDKMYIQFIKQIREFNAVEVNPTKKEIHESLGWSTSRSWGCTRVNALLEAGAITGRYNGKRYEYFLTNLGRNLLKEAIANS